MRLSENSYLLLAGLVQAEYESCVEHYQVERSQASSVDLRKPEHVAAALAGASYWRERADQMMAAGVELDAVYQYLNSRDASQK